MSQKIIFDALMIWVTIEPISALVLFTTVTSGMAVAERRKTAMRATAYSAILLLGAIVVGQIILTAMNIKLISLQVAGGVILFLFGLQMIFGQTAPDSGGLEAGHDVAVFPLTVPCIVGPEAIMAVVMLTDNDKYSIPTQAMTAVVMLAVLGVTYALMLLADPILRVIWEERRSHTGARHGYDPRRAFGRVGNGRSWRRSLGGSSELTCVRPEHEY